LSWKTYLLLTTTQMLLKNIMDQAPAALVRFPEEEEEENEVMVNDEEDDAEVNNPYEEADPHNRPPPAFDEETEFAPPVFQIADVDDVPIPPMHARYRTEKKMAKILRQDELRRNGQEFDITALDSSIRANRSDSSKMMRTMPPKRRSQTNPQLTLTQADVNQLVRDGIAAAIRDERERVRREETRAEGYARGPVTAPIARECSFSGFMKCGPTQFHRTEGAVELVRWFEKMENTFDISECTEVATLGREVANARSWAKVKQIMTNEFCLTEEVQRMEDKLIHLKLRDMNIAAYTERFNELALLCLEAVPNEKKKVELYIKGFPKIIKGETTSSRPVTLNEANRTQGEERGHKSFECPKKADRRDGNVQGQAYFFRDAEHNQGPNVVTGQAYVIRDAEHNQGPNVVTGMFLLNNRYAIMLFDSRADKNFVDIKFSHLIDIKPIKLNSSYKVELANEKVVSTNSVLRGCTLNLIDHLFDIDLMPIELGTFDVIVGMDWLVERDALIVCCKKEVHVPYKNKTLVVKSDNSVSRLKVISSIKARKYIERGSQLFIAQVTEKELAKKQLQDVPMICNLPEVFLDDLTGLPPPRQVEFKIELIPGDAPVARAPYRLTPSELKELSNQLKELSDKGFIRSSSSPWGAPVLLKKYKEKDKIGSKPEKNRKRGEARISLKQVKDKQEKDKIESKPDKNGKHLPEKLRGIHNTFHVSNLKKCLANENLVIPLEEVQLDDKLHFIEEPVEIMDREVK
nr:putative reverse transcriptase domain-containing protein [Tanacetum cinerariifolium]